MNVVLVECIVQSIQYCCFLQFGVLYCMVFMSEFCPGVRLMTDVLFFEHLYFQNLFFFFFKEMLMNILHFDCITCAVLSVLHA